jgi:hypothetical protein
MTRVARTKLASLICRVGGLLLTFLFQGSATTYRREDHYMRGPGPKWRAKHPADHGSGPGS